MNVSPVHIKARELGFDLCGIAPSRKLIECERHLKDWAASSRRGTLGYMSRNLDKRLDPATLVDGARSVVICAVSYRRNGQTDHEVASRIASYALTTDYHITVREKLYALLEFISKEYGAAGRVFVDTAPILEKTWAVEAGLGWIGRNSLLVNPELGSFLILGAIVTDAVLEYDTPYNGNGCKGCSACLKACPAGAISDDRSIDASRCISALTIETSEVVDYPGSQIFGCDICQNICPYNINSKAEANKIFSILPDFLSLTTEDWLSMDELEFSGRFGSTPLSRVPLDTIKKRLRKLIGSI